MSALPLSTYTSSTLEQRGLQLSARFAGWQMNAAGSFYYIPVFLPDGQRGIGADGREWSAKLNVSLESRQKFGKVNLSGKPDDIVYYVLPNFQQTLTSGKLYIASGLTDLLSYHAGGLANVITFLGGELAIPKCFAEDLTSWGILEVIYLPDNDLTGERSAQKLAERLDGSGIKVTLLQLPAQWKDINDMWQHCLPFGDGAASAFRYLVEHASPLIIQPTSSSEKKHSYKNIIDAPRWTIDDETRQAVYLALGVKEIKGSHFKSNPLHCPFHDDQHASAVLFENPTSGLPTMLCSTCGRNYLFKELCQHFDIPFVKKQVVVAVTSSEEQRSDNGDLADKAVAVNATYSSGQQHVLTALPPELRHLMLCEGQVQAARFFDILLACGVELGQAYTAQKLHEKIAVFYPKIGTLRNHLRDFCTGNRHGERDTKRKLVSSSVTEDSTNQSSRPPLQYYIPSFDELCHIFLIFPSPSPDVFSHDALLSNTAYLKAAHLSYIHHNYARWQLEDKYPSGAYLAERLGISRSTLYKYEKEMPNLRKCRRFDVKEVSSDYEMTCGEVDRGCYLIWRGSQQYLKTPLPSARWTCGLDKEDSEIYQLSLDDALIDQPSVSVDVLEESPQPTKTADFEAIGDYQAKEPQRSVLGLVEPSSASQEDLATSSLLSDDDFVLYGVSLGGILRDSLLIGVDADKFVEISCLSLWGDDGLAVRQTLFRLGYSVDVLKARRIGFAAEAHWVRVSSGWVWVPAGIVTPYYDRGCLRMLEIQLLKNGRAVMVIVQWKPPPNAPLTA